MPEFGSKSCNIILYFIKQNMFVGISFYTKQNKKSYYLITYLLIIIVGLFLHVDQLFKTALELFWKALNIFIFSLIFSLGYKLFL